MSTWLEQYKQELDGIIAAKRARIKQTQSSPAMADAYLAIQRMQFAPKENAPDNYTEEDSKSGLRKAGDSALSGGLWAVDKLSRPLYGVMNTMKEQQDIYGNDSISDTVGHATGYNFIKTLLSTDAFKEGFTGEEKSTGKDLIDASQGHDTGATGAWAGFAADVLVDPLNVIGVGAVKAGAKGIKKITGVGKKGADDALTNPVVYSADEAFQGGLAEKSILNNILDTVKADEIKLHPDTPFLPKGQTLVAGSDGVVPTPAPRAITAVPTTIGENVARVADNELNEARAAVESVTSKMSQVPTRRYKPDVKVATPFREIIEEVPVEKAYKRAPTKGAVNAALKELTEDANAVVKIKTKTGKTASVSVVHLLKEAEKNPAYAEKVTKLLQAEAVKIAKQSVVTGKRMTKAQKKTYAALPKAERAKWVREHKDLFDPEDFDKLRKTRVRPESAESWNKAISEVLGKKIPKAYDYADDLVRAVREGDVDPADLKEIMQAVGAKSPTGIKRGLEQLSRKAGQLELKTWKEQGKTADTRLWDTGARADEVAAYRAGQTVDAAPTSTSPFDTSTLPEPYSVKTAPEIVREVIEEGNNAHFAAPKEALDPKQIDDFKTGLQYAVNREIIDPSIAAKYGYVSKSGTRRTASKMHQGVGRNFEDWNKYSQLTVVKGIIKRRTAEIEREISAKGLKGGAAQLARSEAMYAHVMPIMRSIDRVLLDNGISPVLGVNEKYAVSLVNVLDSMPEAFVKTHFFNHVRSPEHIPPTFWNDAGIIVMDHSKGIITYDDAIKGVANTLIAKQTTYSGKQLYTGVRTKFYSIKDSAAREKYIEGIAKQFLRAGPHLRQLHETNIAQAVATDINGAAKVTQETMRAFGELVSSPNFSAYDLLKMANDSDEILETTAKASGVGGKRALDLAREDVKIKFAAMVPPEVRANAVDAARVYRAVGKPRKINALTKALDNTEIAAKQIQDEIGESITDIGLNAERVLGYKLLKAFAPHLGNKDIRHMFLSRNSFGQTVSRLYADKLSRTVRNHAKTDIAAAWREIQQGTISKNPAVAAAQAELHPVVKTLFNDADGYNILDANGISPDEVNRFFSKYGIHEKYRLTDDYANDWKRWDTNDVPDLMSRMQAAIMAAVTHTNVGADLSRRFGQRAAGPGMVKIRQTPDSILSKHIDTTRYYPKDIAEQMSVLDKAMKEIAAPNRDGAALKFLDNVTHMYKTGLTIYRPGHHIRNMNGDMWLTYADGIVDPRVYKTAMRVMASGRGRYDDWDALKALMVDGKAPRVDATATVTYVRIGGKKTPLTASQVWDMAHSRGLLPDFSTIEDINITPGAIKSKLHLPGKMKGKLHNAAASVSQSRDHYARLAHFVGLLEKGNYRTLDEAADQITPRVRKWHPDGSDLTNFETKAMRRAFLFYSWIRKTIPLVVETAAMHPGRVMLAPKASYALAESNGIDLDGFGDPFPADQLFPEFLSDNVLGPQFGSSAEGYWGINPGIPSVDVANDFANSPGKTLRTVLGSTTPIAKIPFEVGTAEDGAVAKDIRTGVPQTDLSDYIDRQIPGVNVLSNLTNRSVASGFTQGTGESIGDTPEQLFNAEQSNPTGGDKTAFFNWLVGAGLMDMSKPGYKKQAKREQGR